MKKVMAFGTFDVVHEGHLHYLREAKKLGDYLIVVVARDRNSFGIKGRRPRHNEQIRLLGIKIIDFVDEAVLGDKEMRSWEIIQKYRPVAIALGYDQWKTEVSLEKELDRLGVHPLIVRIPPFMPEQFKASRILGGSKQSKTI
ncbi:MAG: FAD synthase [Candidatus ainarchaeum sp.]|nr:FAD synthase [Candidatus ainarchaeum sp.]